MNGPDALIEYLRRQIEGPFDGEEETIADPPTQRYIVGVLHPQGVDVDDALAAEEFDVPDGSSQDVTGAPVDDPIALSSQWMPSSVGLSFYVEAQAVDVSLRAAVYEKTPAGWSRRSLSGSGDSERVRLVPGVGRSQSVTPVLDGRGKLHALWRPLGPGHLLTVSLVNAESHESGGPSDASKALCQAGVECEPVLGVIRDYPDIELLSKDDEVEELAVLYRRHRIFAIGHGCAADWDLAGEDATADRVRTTFVPEFETPQLVPREPDAGIFRMSNLANCSERAGWLAAGLDEFVSDFEQWIERLPRLHADVPPALNEAASRILGRLSLTALRMRRGIELLSSDPQVREAFALANRAVLMAMRHAQTDLAGSSHERDLVELDELDYSSLTYAWRPFQLAFQLVVLPSLAEEGHPERDLVDLLWFPTGGGKTEAYLALTAFTIVLRRLRDPDNGSATEVITRYTLRLLTAQQFQRAAGLICALELLRRDDEARLGRTPVSIGLWVGSGATPNDYQEAKELYDALLQDETPVSPFQIERCPWCGTKLVPKRRTEDEDAYGFSATNASFRIYCTTSDCPFHDDLPINVVDDHLYRNPPTFLIATVDKFARLAWVAEAGVFFGGNGRPGPSLIIQDELHLLSGPLGTTVGLYEAAIELIIQRSGAHPKVIASTATIRRASEQSLGLFGRELALFPSPGLEAGDSYFARVDRERPGRRYVGVMSQSHTPSTSLIHVSAAVAQAPIARSGLSPTEYDAYWTQVVYHNSLRELGKTITFARDDIPARIGIIAEDEATKRGLDDDAVVELTSNIPGHQLPDILRRMSLPHDDPEAVSLLACTNMLSVGVDVPRLGLMVVNGQPKTTSEYIQATSRVGRGGASGIVICLYASTKPRDRSHYETFRPYHESLYRYVEPTSVTPFSLPSRNRSLHAALVILARHGLGLSSNGDAAAFDSQSPDIRSTIDDVVHLVKTVDPDEAEETRLHLERLVSDWDERAKDDTRPLVYQSRGRQHGRLLKEFGATGEGWDTLQSMRNVDRTCRIEVIGATQ